MQIRRAEELGMCFGVRDALTTIQSIATPRDVTIHGELVHNGEVLADLDRRGFHRSPEQARPVPPTPWVLVTAHGISERERARLLGAGKQLVDTTCPLVQRAHAAAQELAAEGRRVIVLGKRDHVEVRGIVEDLDRAIVIGAIGDVATWPEPRLGIVSQTTTETSAAEQLVAAVRARNAHADVRWLDTICSPTRQRIAALQALLPQIDALVVVGGHDSNNTRQLVQKGLQAGLPTLHVERPDELDAAWFAGHGCVGLTAGTSTLASTVDAVEARLREIAAQATSDGGVAPLRGTHVPCS